MILLKQMNKVETCCIKTSKLFGLDQKSPIKSNDDFFVSVKFLRNHIKMTLN